MLLTASDLFRSSWEIYQKNFWLLLGYAAWLIVPFAAFLIIGKQEELSVIIMALVLLVSAIELFVLLWVSITITQITEDLSQDKPINEERLTLSIGRISPLLVVSFLQIIIALGGLVLLIIPGLIFSIWYGFAQFPVILSGTSPIKALSESRELVRGRFFPVLWRIFSVPLVIGIMYSAVVGSLIFIIASTTGTDPITVVSSELPMWAETLELLGELLLAPLMLIYTTVLYLDLKKNPLEPPVPVR